MGRLLQHNAECLRILDHIVRPDVNDNTLTGRPAGKYNAPLGGFKIFPRNSCPARRAITYRDVPATWIRKHDVKNDFALTLRRRGVSQRDQRGRVVVEDDPARRSQKR